MLLVAKPSNSFVGSTLQAPCIFSGIMLHIFVDKSATSVGSRRTSTIPFDRPMVYMHADSAAHTSLEENLLAVKMNKCSACPLPLATKPHPTSLHVSLQQELAPLGHDFKPHCAESARKNRDIIKQLHVCMASPREAHGSTSSLYGWRPASGSYWHFCYVSKTSARDSRRSRIQNKQTFSTNSLITTSALRTILLTCLWRFKSVCNMIGKIMLYGQPPFSVGCG